MELTRRSSRHKTNCAPFTPAKTVTVKPKTKKVKTVNKVQSHKMTYELNREKAVKQKQEAAERAYTVNVKQTEGNIVLEFSAAAYEEFKSVTINYLKAKNLSLNNTQSIDGSGAVATNVTGKGNTLHTALKKAK